MARAADAPSLVQRLQAAWRRIVGLGKTGEPGLDSLPLAVLHLAGETIAYANPAAGDLLGLAPEALLGRALSDFMMASELGTSGHIHRLQRADGTVFLAEAAFAPYWAPDGTRQIQVTLQDVTEPRRTQGLLDRLLERNSSFLLCIDDTGRIVRACGTGLARLGLAEAALAGWRARDVLPAGLAELRAAWEAGERVYESHDLPGPDGPVAVAVYLFSDPIAADARVYCLGLDITERVAREHEADRLARNNAMFASTLQNTKRAILIADPHQADMPLIFANPAAETITGYPRDELLGRNCRLLQGPDTDPDAVETLRLGIAERRTVSTVLLNYRRDGTPFWNEVIVSPVFADAAETGLLYFAGICDDVSERVELARERTELIEQMQHAQKMEAVGRLAGGIAHDFNNILATVLGNAELLQEDAADGETRALVERIISSAGRGRDMVQRLLTFSRQDSSRAVEAVDLAALAAEAADLLRPSLPATAQLTVDVEAAREAPSIAADSGQLNQAILNIALNAAHAVGYQPAQLHLAVTPVAIDGGRAEGLRARSAQADGALLVEGGRDPWTGAGDKSAVQVFTGLLAPGAHLCLSLADDGPGMDRATAERLFEPFFTTKPVGEGTGLGLPAVQGIVLDHGGALSVTTQPGRGTRFEIYFPVPAAEPG